MAERKLENGKSQLLTSMHNGPHQIVQAVRAFCGTDDAGLSADGSATSGEVLGSEEKRDRKVEGRWSEVEFGLPEEEVRFSFLPEMTISRINFADIRRVLVQRTTL